MNIDYWLKQLGKIDIKNINYVLRFKNRNKNMIFWSFFHLTTLNIFKGTIIPF